MAYERNNIVEATSLSHVTNVAAHPPENPNTAIDGPRLPLVLYIARVPGSRDVFLTPLKPREKIVTAEDVQSSLYYVHVNCHDDFQEPHRRPSSVNTDASNLLPVPEEAKARKPLLPARPLAPPTPPYPLTDAYPSGRQRQPSPPRSRILRKPVGMGTSSTQTINSDLPVLPPRPLPLTPVDEQSRNSSLHADNIRLLRRTNHSEENNPYSRPCAPQPLSLEPAILPEPGSLTLIRRDPSSNNQWDVASIHDPPVPEISSTALLDANAAKRTKRGGAPLYIDISNPGYAVFVPLDRPASQRSNSSSDSDPPPDGVFRRRLYMPGSQYGEHNYSQHRKFASVGSFDHSEDVSVRRTMRNSIDTSTPTSTPTADRRRKGYTFTSPWDARCEFTTGATGKSLKCKHFLPQQNGGVQEVSELRFNLPTKSSRTATAVSEKRSSYFHRLHGRSQSGEDDDVSTPTFIIDENGKLDLTLGQERAGGGFGGKQAKLGKLIIEPEGLKMLDLLVAANVGLWWRAYERG